MPYTCISDDYCIDWNVVLEIIGTIISGPVGCAAGSSVIRRDDGKLETNGSGYSKNAAEEKAFKEASAYCLDEGYKHYRVLKKDSTSSEKISYRTGWRKEFSPDCIPPTIEKHTKDGKPVYSPWRPCYKETSYPIPDGTYTWWESTIIFKCTNTAPKKANKCTEKTK